MEDVATAEISRSQIWQWIRYEVVTREGTHVTRSLVEQIIFDIINGLERNENDRFEDAVTIFRQICLDEDHFPTFLTLSAYSQFMVSAAPGHSIK
jgi:malate synthase